MTTGCENCDFMDMRHQPDRVLEATTTTFEGTCANIDPDNSWVARWIGCAGFVPGLYVSPRPPHHDSHVLLSLSYIYCVLVNLETALRRRMASAATERAIEREREREKKPRVALPTYHHLFYYFSVCADLSVHVHDNDDHHHVQICDQCATADGHIRGTQ